MGTLQTRTSVQVVVETNKALNAGGGIASEAVIGALYALSGVQQVVALLAGKADGLL